MQQVPIKALPNQQLSIILDNNNWDITIKTTNGQVSVTLVLNTVTILENIRAVAGQFIIPYSYLEKGNFFFVTADQQLPDYTQFNVTQSLVYISQDEIAALSVPPSPPVTAAFFNPIAALPLRFKPQGYVKV